MKYNNESVRRQDRLLSEEEAIRLLQQGEYGFLAMVSEKQSGYGIPLNYVLYQDRIYFHCAPEGEKLKILAANNKVSFCVVGKTQVISDKFTTAYESVQVKGTVTFHLPDEEKKQALELIVDKYSPNDKGIGLTYIKKSLHRTEVIRLDIQSISGKGKAIKA